VFPVSLMQPSEGLGDFTVAQYDEIRLRILQKLRDVRAQMSRTNDPTLLTNLKASEKYGIAALAEMTQAANNADQPALWVRAINIADDATRAMGAAVAEVVVAIGETAGDATKPLIPTLWPIALGLIGVAFIMGGGIKTGRR
jgi:hypothetical protein